MGFVVATHEAVAPSRPATDRPGRARIVVGLSWLIAALALPATLVGLFWRGGPGSFAVTTRRPDRLRGGIVNAASWQRLSIGDLMTLWAQTPATPMNIAMLGLLPAAGLLDGDGDLRLADLRAAVADRLDRAPALRRRIKPTRLGQGGPIWVDDGAFDVARHVEEVRLPGIDPDRLLSWSATRAATGLDARHPPWRLTFVTGMDTGEVGLLLVLHHAIADGITGVALATALLDAAPGERLAPTSWAPAPPPPAGVLVRDAAARWWRALGRLAAAARHPSGLRRDLRVARTALAQRAPELALPVPRTSQRHAVALRWPLAVVRESAHHHRVTINELMLASVAAGMRSLLTERGVPVAGLGLRVSVPVAAPAGSRNAGGTLPMMLTLPVGDPDPASTLRRVNEISRQAKAGRDRSYAGPAQTALLPQFAVRLGTRWLRRHGGSRISLYLTNVPGPAHPLWLRGARLHAAYPIAPVAAGVPIAAAVLSYGDTLCLTVNADPRLDLRPFATGARQAMEQLIITPEAAVGRSA
jgi:WS/DGAT/MGAT family acyltransferase